MYAVRTSFYLKWITSHSPPFAKEWMEGLTSLSFNTSVVGCNAGELKCVEQ